MQARFSRAPPGSVAISAITLGEVLFGLEGLADFHPLRLRVTRFLNSLDILDWPADAAGIYGAIRYRTRQQPVGDRDMMIAAHAISIGAIVVTNNTKHFSRMDSALRIENWVW